MPKAEVETSDHWHMLSEDQQNALLLEFREDDGWNTRELRLGPYNEPCHICCDPFPKGQTQVDRLWIDRAPTISTGPQTYVICINRPACKARVSIKAQEVENIAKEIARRVEV